MLGRIALIGGTALAVSFLAGLAAFRWLGL